MVNVADTLLPRWHVSCENSIYVLVTQVSPESRPTVLEVLIRKVEGHFDCEQAEEVKSTY